MNKKYLVIVCCYLFVSSFCLAGTGGLDAVKEILGNIQDAILKIGGGFCVLMIMIGGAIYMTAQDDANQMKTGIGTVKYALFGLVIVLAAVLLLNFVNGFGN